MIGATKLLGVSLLVAVTGLLVATCATGCASADQKAAAADTAYGADQLECVKSASTREQADACRAAKRQMWDAGTEAGK